MKISIKGPIISDGEQWIYDWFGIPAVSPSKVSQMIDEAVRNQSKELTVVINSGGGSVFAASEIYTELKSFKGKVNTEIVGLAASAASVIAMAGYISMSPTAQLMIHNAATWTQGDYREMDYTSDFLQNINKSIMNAYTLKSGKTEDELKNMMDKETWMTAQQALEHGFIDVIMFEQEKRAVANINHPTLINGVLPSEVIEKVRNEFLKDKNISMVSQFNSSIDPVASTTLVVNNQVKNKGDDQPMNLEELKNNHPELYQTIKNQGYEEGVKAENARIKSVEDSALPGYENLVNKAKYEEPINGDQLAAQIIRAQREQGSIYLNNRNDDAKVIDSVRGSETLENKTDDQEIEESANTIASFINKKRGVNK